MTANKKPRNISMDDELHQRILQAALEAGADRGEPVSFSEWLREAAKEKLGDLDG